MSLEWAVELGRVANRPGLPNHVCGLTAYGAWADALEIDASYKTDRSIEPPDPESPTAPHSVMETRAMVHGDQATMLAERAEAARFLRRMAEHAGPAEAALREAADLYEQVGKINVWPWRGRHYMADDVKEGLRDGSTRRELAAAVRAAAELERRAVRLLEEASDALNRTP
jgi:hypothetical protein